MANLRTNNLSGEQGQNAYRGSVQFNDDDYLQIADSADIEFGSNDYTVEFWAIFTKKTSSTDYEEIVNKGYPFQIYRYTANDSIALAVDSNTSSYDINATFGTAERGHWHHIAVSRSGNTTKAFLNGIQGLSSTSSTSINDTGSAFTIGAYADSLGSYKFRGVISNVRVVIGTALYTADFTPPTEELKIVDGTAILCCQDSNDPTQEATGKTITGFGDLATAGYLETQPKVIPPYGVDAGNTFGGPIQQSSQGYMCFPTGRTEERGRGRGLFGGGVTPSGTSRISFVNIQSQGNSIKFGSLTRGSTLLASCSSQTRGLWGGNYPSATNVIDFVTIATTGDAQDFGDLTVARWNFAALSNETRGVFCGGHSPTQHNTMDFVTMATLGDATDFGDLLSKFSGVSSCASPTRGLIFGGTDPSGSPISGKTNIIEFITIASTGDAQDFGDLTEVKHNSSGLSSQTRGINAGGNPGSMSDVIAFVTIATTGDATDFGNLITGRQGPATASNSIRGLFASGVTPSNTNLIDFITIATTANASDFGDIDPVQTHFPEGCSDSHGGLS